MPKIIRKATLLLSAEELSAALGIPYHNVENVEWWSKDGETCGLKFTVSVEEDLLPTKPALEQKS